MYKYYYDREPAPQIELGELMKLWATANLSSAYWQNLQQFYDSTDVRDDRLHGYRTCAPLDFYVMECVRAVYFSNE